jgi:YD repeat-containing protein
VYNSETVNRRPIIEIAVATNAGAGVPTEIKARLTWNNGTPQDWVTFSTSGHAAGDTYAIATQVASAVSSTGVYPYKLRVVVTFPSAAPIDVYASGYVGVVVNDDSSNPFGKGWSLTGLDKLTIHSAGVFRVLGTGQGRFYANAPGGGYTSPQGDFGTLVKNADNSFTYTDKYRTKWEFSSTGVLNKVVDPHGLTATYTYFSGLLTNIDTPTSYTIFNYAGGRLVYIIQPTNRILTPAQNGSGQLTQITDMDGSLRTFSYDSLNRLTNERRGQLSVTYAYDTATGGLSSVDYGLGTTYTYAPANAKALRTNPAVSLSQVTGDVIDPRNFPTTHTLDLMGRLLQLKLPDGATHTWARNDHGQVTLYTDPLNRVTTYTYAMPANGDVTRIDYPDGSTYQYQYHATFHLVTQIQDPLNRLTTFTYDAQTADLLTIRDALNQVTTQTWSNGLLQSITDPLGHTTTFQYVSRRLEERIDALNNRTTYTYDSNGNQRTVKDALGRVTTTVYDALNRLVSVTDAAQGVSTVAYNALGAVTSRTDVLGRRTDYSYDQRGWLIATTEAVGTPEQRTSTLVDNAAGNLLASVDPLGNRTTYTYDALNRRIATRDALNNLSTVVYDLAGNVLATVNIVGGGAHRTTFTYDALNRRIATRDAFNNLSTVAYDASGNVLATMDELSRRTTYTYDALNRRIATRDAHNFLSTVVYDAVGNVLATVDQLGNRTTFTYDALNRRIATRDALNKLSTTVYDAAGNVVNMIDPLGNKTTYVYDILNRRTKTIDARGGVETTVYDAVSNVINIIDPVGNQTTFVYDMLHRLIQQVDPLGNAATFAYDAAGRMTSTTDRLARRRDFAYDAVNRLTTETWVTGGGIVSILTFSYDAHSNLLTAAKGFHTYTFTYDALNRTSTVKQPFGQTLTLTYDAVGNRTRRDDSSGGVLTSVYDAANRLTSRRFGGSGQTPLRIDFTYTGRHERATETRYSDLAGTQSVGSATYSYDAVGRLTNLQHRTGGGSLLANYTYTYDAASRLLPETLNGTTKTYTYDTTHQLTNDGSTAFSYDLNGNRTMAGYQTGTGNRISNDGTWTYTYDAEGNLTKKSNSTVRDYGNSAEISGCADPDLSMTICLQCEPPLACIACPVFPGRPECLKKWSLWTNDHIQGDDWS